jgi:hypothetical protein
MPLGPPSPRVWKLKPGLTERLCPWLWWRIRLRQCPKEKPSQSFIDELSFSRHASALGMPYHLQQQAVAIYQRLTRRYPEGKRTQQMALALHLADHYFGALHTTEGQIRTPLSYAQVGRQVNVLEGTLKRLHSQLAQKAPILRKVIGEIRLDVPVDSRPIVESVMEQSLPPSSFRGPSSKKTTL